MGKRGIKPNQERRDMIKAKRESGVSVIDIANELGVSRQVIYQQLYNIRREEKRAAELAKVDDME